MRAVLGQQVTVTAGRSSSPGSSPSWARRCRSPSGRSPICSRRQPRSPGSIPKPAHAAQPGAHAGRDGRRAGLGPAGARRRGRPRACARRAAGPAGDRAVDGRLHRDAGAARPRRVHPRRRRACATGWRAWGAIRARARSSACRSHGGPTAPTPSSTCGPWPPHDHAVHAHAQSRRRPAARRGRGRELSALWIDGQRWAPAIGADWREAGEPFGSAAGSSGVLRRGADRV